MALQRRERKDKIAIVLSTLVVIALGTIFGLEHADDALEWIVAAAGVTLWMIWLFLESKSS